MVFGQSETLMSKEESRDPLKPLWDDTGQDPQMDLLEWIKQRPRSEMQTGRRRALPVVVSVPKCRQKGTGGLVYTVAQARGPR